MELIFHCCTYLRMYVSTSSSGSFAINRERTVRRGARGTGCVEDCKLAVDNGSRSAPGCLLARKLLGNFGKENGRRRTREYRVSGNEPLESRAPVPVTSNPRNRVTPVI